MDSLDIAIVGAGPTGLATAIEAHRRGLKYLVFDKGCITNSILGFPTHMVFFTTPELLEIGGIPLITDREKPTRNEALKYYRKIVKAFGLKVKQFEEVREIKRTDASIPSSDPRREYEAGNIVLATGYYDNPNILGIPGEDLPHVSHYYTEPYSFFDRDVVIVGGRNSAAEAALDLFRGGARVTLVHRGAEMGSTLKYWVRPDIENRFKAGEVKAFFNTLVKRITPSTVEIPGRNAAHASRTSGVSAYRLPLVDEIFRATGSEMGPGYPAAALQPGHLRDKRAGSLPRRIR